MGARNFILAATVLPAVVIGCSSSQSTPPEVDAEFRALLETAEQEPPGASIARLTEFRKKQSRYDIVTEVDGEIERLGSIADGRYHEARELAREGDFERAEGMLQDLAACSPETSGAESAKQHLAFDFYLGKAKWLLVHQRWEEGGEVARSLLDRDLTREQREQVEAILDHTAHVTAAYAQATRAQARVACRELAIHLQMMQAEDGRYPSRLSLSDVEAWDPMGTRSILRALSAIERYEQTDRGSSFTAVSAGGEHRIRVVDGVVEE